MQDLNDKVTGSTLSATEWNQVPSEIQNVIEALGISLSAADLNQLGKGIAGYVANGNFYTDSGSPNAYTLTQIGSKQAAPAYADGMAVMFVAGNANTGASTVNVAGLGVVNIKLKGGITDPSANDIQTDRTTRLVYRTSPSAHFELDRSGEYIKTVVTVSDASFTLQPDTKSVKFTAVGAGGGGGGVDGQGAGTSAAGGGGGGGGSSLVTTKLIDASYNITIGAGGTGGAAGNNNGNNGGDTSVVSTNVNISATGGAGGSGNLAASGSGGGLGGFGGSGSGGGLNIDGSDGDNGRFAGGSLVNYGVSGASILGGFVRGTPNSSGRNATTFGAGGSGATVDSQTTNFAGGDGANGVVVVEEFL